MYICVYGYRARGVSSHVYMGVGIEPSSGLVQGRFPHTHIHDYSHLWLGRGSIPTHTYIHYYSLLYICVYGYRARGVSSHVYMGVGIEPEEWVVMYICACGYRPCRYPHTHIYITTHSSGLVQGRYPQAHIYMTTHSTGSIPTPIWVVMYICVWLCTKPEEWVVMYICVLVSSLRSE
jgi:hypothetical protein